MKVKKSNRLNVKIIIIILLSALLVSLMTSFVLYDSFSGSMAEMVGMEYDNNFHQILDDINGIYDESIKYAQQIAISETAQDYLTEDPALYVTERMKHKRDMINYMSGMVILSQGIHSMAIVKEGEVLAWTTLPFMDEESGKMCQNWYDSFRETLRYNDDGYGISEPYDFSFNNNNGIQRMHLISIEVPIYSMRQAHTCIGRLIVNIETDTLKEQIRSGAKGFAFILYRDGEEILTGEGTVDEKLWREAEEKGSRTRFPLYYSETTGFGGELIAVVDQPETLQLFRVTMTKMLPILLVVLVMIILLLVPVLLYMMHPVKILANAMQRVGAGEMDTRVDIHTGDEFETLGVELNRMVGQLDEYLRSTIQGEKDRHELEYEVLVAQINPHFIYNTLNTVIYLAKKQQNEDVIKITRALIDLLQDGIRLSDNKNFSTVEEEMWIIQNYVCIQNYRYKDKFDVQIQCPEELKKYRVPSSVIQPIVENALFHGIVPLDRRGTIVIRIWKEGETAEERLHIRISDDGIGMSRERMQAILSGSLQVTDDARNHVGIQNVIKRLSLLYEGRQEFRISSTEGEGTVMEMILPVEQIDEKTLTAEEKV